MSRLRADVAKWLRQWIVIPPFAGSIPVVRPLDLGNTRKYDLGFKETQEIKIQ